MFPRAAHLLLCLAAIPANATVCGVVGGQREIATVDPRGEVTFVDGRRARLGGLALAPGATAALAALEGRPLGVALIAPRPDRWGRLVVDLAEQDGESVALDLVLQGLARVAPEFETRACETERLEAEAAARAAGEGVWTDPKAILEATDRVALDAADGRFVLVKGLVRRVGGTRAKIYLDFAGRGGFSVVVARKAEPLFRRLGIALGSLAGRKVLARGVLDDRFGPRIELADPSLIELEEGSRETNRGG